MPRRTMLIYINETVLFRSIAGQRVAG